MWYPNVWRGYAYQRLKTYFVKLSRADGSSLNNTILDKIEPGKLTTLVAKVYDRNNRSIPNVDVQLSLEAKHGSGGHNHGDDTVVLRTGALNGQKVLTGKTDSNGFQFKYKAPDVSGDVTIKASCISGNSCPLQGPDTVWAGIKDLIPLPANNNYMLIGKTDTHSDNHYMTYGASIKLMQLADLYRRRFPGDPLLHVNDASLERGGLFDLSSNWSDKPNGHELHRRGTEVDIRANPDFNPSTAIPAGKNFEIFEEIVLRIGGGAKIHSPGKPNQHYHVKF